MSQGGDAFVRRSLGNVLNGARGGKDWFVSCVVQ